MSSVEIKENICRVCMGQNVVLNWNNELFEYCGMTYKDCYYKYTQLEYLVADPFSPMLCHSCSKGLQNLHTLISNALESHKMFLKTFHVDSIEGDLKTIACDIKYTPAEFETVLVEKIEVEPLIEDHFDSGSFDEEFNVKSAKIKSSKKIKLSAATVKQEKSKNKVVKFIKIENEAEGFVGISKLNLDNLQLSSNISTEPQKATRNESMKLISSKAYGNKIRKSNLTDQQTDKQRGEFDDTIKDGSLDEIINVSEKQIAPKVKKKYKEKKKPRMCSICSKILHNKYAVQMHERTHIENRERKESCPVCGLKFYDKRNLYSHMHIHKENREKKHKCEFCNKAFYDKGGLNIHRRIHLGQMIPCSLCSKQYFRQIDLDRHMSSHSATTINSDTKKRSRYFVRCEHCDKSILSTSFKSHTAAHLNEPLMKCSICSKEFFRRQSCVLHMKKVHQKTNEEYNDFIIQYKKNRISHLFLEQKADIQVNDE